MAITIADRVRIRELWHAYNHTIMLRTTDPQLDLVITQGKTAADSLYNTVSAILAEEADDPPFRAARDRAATELRSVAIASIGRLRAIVALRATDPTTGLVIDQAALDRVDALADKYLPRGQLSGIASEGPALLMQAGLVRDAVNSEPECTALISNFDRLLAEHRSAMERVSQEAEELAAARKGLESARQTADRMRRAGWHYVNFLQSWDGVTIDINAIYPVAERAKTRTPEEADAELDEAGAPVPPVTPEGEAQTEAQNSSTPSAS